MMLDDLLDCDKCELDLCSSLQLQGIGPQRAGEENWQSRTCCNAQTPPPFKARIGKIEAIYYLPIRTNANAYQYPVWRCIKVIQSDSNVFNVSESNFVTHAASFCTQKLHHDNAKWALQSSMRIILFHCPRQETLTATDPIQAASRSAPAPKAQWLSTTPQCKSISSCNHQGTLAMPPVVVRRVAYVDHWIWQHQNGFCGKNESIHQQT